MKVLLAPDYGLNNLAETHRMNSLGLAFLEMGHEVYVLGGKGKYKNIWNDSRFKTVEIEYDYEWIKKTTIFDKHDFDNIGFNMFEQDELERFVEEEIKLLMEIKPDIVMQGFRPSMSISTKVTGIKYITIYSAVISDLYSEYDLMTMPHRANQAFPGINVIRKILGKKLFKKIFLEIIVMKKWYKTWNSIMKKYNLPKYKMLFGVFKGDLNLLSDAPELFPEFEEIPEYFAFCGPMLPEIKVDEPECLKNFVKKDRPVIFFSMGSSGDPEIMKEIIESFDGKNYDVFVALTSIIKKEELDFIPENVYVEKMFPALKMNEIADVSVSHGGQGTIYTSIMAGTPFVGIPMFNEQQWNIETIQRREACKLLKRTKLNIEDIHDSINEILNDGKYKKNMLELREKIIKYRDDNNLYPPKRAVELIVDFINTNKKSYFEEKGY